jgi:hypothetical protein
MLKPSLTIKSIAKTIITTADTTSELVNTSGKATIKLANGVSGFFGVFESWGTVAEREAIIDGELSIQRKLRDAKAEFEKEEFTLPEGMFPTAEPVVA